MIPIARPQVSDPEIENVVHVLKSGMLAGGRFVNDFEGAFADYTGTTYAVATTSGTVALDIALKALGIKNGDEFNKKRIGNAEYLNNHLDAPLKTPYKKDNINHVYHKYVIKLGEEFSMKRDEFISYLSDNGIGSAVHYPLPVHRQPIYQEMGYERDQCRCATRLSEDRRQSAGVSAGDRWRHGTYL